MILDCRSYKAHFNLSLHGFQTKDTRVKSITGIVRKILQLHVLPVYPHDMKHLQYSFVISLAVFSHREDYMGCTR